MDRFVGESASPVRAAEHIGDARRTVGVDRRLYEPDQARFRQPHDPVEPYLTTVGRPACLESQEALAQEIDRPRRFVLVAVDRGVLQQLEHLVGMRIGPLRM